MDKNTKDILVFLGVGLVAGFLASILVGGNGLIYYLVIGVLGSVVGGFLLSKLGVNIATGNAMANKIVTSAFGAIIVVIVAKILT